MVDQVIGSILEAEEKADRIVKEASENAKTTMLAAEEAAERKKEETVTSFKTERKNALRLADEEAEKRYRDRLNAGGQEAESLKDAARSRVEKAADDIVGRIIGEWQ